MWLIPIPQASPTPSPQEESISYIGEEQSEYCRSNLAAQGNSPLSLNQSWQSDRLSRNPRKPDAASAARPPISHRPSVVETGSATTKPSMLSFLMLGTVVISTIPDIRSAGITSLKNIQATGRSVPSAVRHSKTRCSYGMERTNTTSRFCATYRHSSRPIAPSVASESILLWTDAR
jgi:hypothetical protein